MLSVRAGDDGKPRDVRVIKSLGMGLDEQAVEAVSQRRFAPGSNGSVDVDFHLPTDQAGWRLASAAFDMLQGATPPHVIRATYPSLPGPAAGGSVRLSFDVDEQGVPGSIHVENSSDRQLEDEVIAMIREWRFLAALRNDVAVRAHGSLEFHRGDVPAIPGRAIQIRPKLIPPHQKQISLVDQPFLHVVVAEHHLVRGPRAVEKVSFG